MNRLQAARGIKYGLHVRTRCYPNGAELYTHIYYNNVGQDKIFFSEEYIGGDMDSETSDWKGSNWRDTLRFIRDQFPRRVEGQCEHKFCIWSGNHIVGHARCVNTCEHFHCVKCGTAETAVEVYSKLCAECSEEADKVRREITFKVIQFEETFGIPFKEDAVVRAAYEGNYDERCDTDYREDFHSDG